MLISFNYCSVFHSLVSLVAGCRNISNALSIGTKIDRSSADLKEVAQKHGFWDGQVSATMFLFLFCFFVFPRHLLYLRTRVLLFYCRNSSVYK